jgi:PAS domain-containing protein
VVGQHAGLRGPEFGVFLVVIWSVVSFGALTWWNSGSRYRLRVERQRAEEGLKKGQAQLAEAQRIARVGSWEWDLRSGHFSWSDELCRTFGVAPGEFDSTFEGFVDFVHPDDHDLVRQSFEQSNHTGEPFGLDCRIVRAMAFRRRLARSG